MQHELRQQHARRPIAIVVQDREHLLPRSCLHIFSFAMFLLYVLFGTTFLVIICASTARENVALSNVRFDAAC